MLFCKAFSPLWLPAGPAHSRPFPTAPLENVRKPCARAPQLRLPALAQDWIAAHPKGTYPAGVRRIDLKDEWLEADKQYAASLAPA